MHSETPAPARVKVQGRQCGHRRGKHLRVPSPGLPVRAEIRWDVTPPALLVHITCVSQPWLYFSVWCSALPPGGAAAPHTAQTSAGRDPGGLPLAGLQQDARRNAVGCPPCPSAQHVAAFTTCKINCHSHGKKDIQDSSPSFLLSYPTSMDSLPLSGSHQGLTPPAPLICCAGTHSRALEEAAVNLMPQPHCELK